MRWAAAGTAVALVVLPGCRSSPEKERSPAATATVSVAPVPSEPPPKVLYLPSAGDRAPGGVRPPTEPPAIAPSARRCPAEMVPIGGEFCIDRYEATLVDATSGRRVSPHYHPTKHEVTTRLRIWRRRRHQEPTVAGKMMPVPPPPDWQRERTPAPRAESRAASLPNGYLSLPVARAACQRAGKRLCTESEWERACRGEAGRQFPYGEKYQDGACNVFREDHPAAKLHGNASKGHLDPRLNLVKGARGPLLRRTGASKCESRWGDDAVHDMVGNLDEWVDDDEGVFRGGFFSRSTRDGCKSRISAHGPTYFDYSLGVRCCRAMP